MPTINLPSPLRFPGSVGVFTERWGGCRRVGLHWGESSQKRPTSAGGKRRMRDSDPFGRPFLSSEVDGHHTPIHFQVRLSRSFWWLRWYFQTLWTDLFFDQPVLPLPPRPFLMNRSSGSRRSHPFCRTQRPFSFRR